VRGVKFMLIVATVKQRTPDLRTYDKRKLGPGNIRKIEESAGILLVKSLGSRNKMQYFGNSGEILLLTALSHPFPRWGKMLPPPSSPFSKNIGYLNKV
jgi:hypothetical protein